MFISIHVPSWGTTEEAIDIDDDEEISIHVPSWGTTVPGKTVQLVYDQFQSTFPRGERPLSGSASLRSVYFNPRSLVGNDREPFFEGVLLHYFNPRSLVGNDDIYKGLHPLVRISIHVPSWGTTMIHPKLLHQQHISIHVPSWGTTHPDNSRIPLLFYFNPRSLVGNDAGAQPVSYHSQDFNPRSLVGNDRA